MAVVWTLSVPDTGTGRLFSIEDRIWDGQRTSVSATAGWTLGASRGVPRQTRTRGGGLGDDFKTVSLQRHFWVRNAPNAVDDRGNPLKSQQIRAPSERTKISRVLDTKRARANVHGFGFKIPVSSTTRSKSGSAASIMVRRYAVSASVRAAAGCQESISPIAAIAARAWTSMGLSRCSSSALTTASTNSRGGPEVI